MDKNKVSNHHSLLSEKLKPVTNISSRLRQFFPPLSRRGYLFFRWFLSDWFARLFFQFFLPLHWAQLLAYFQFWLVRWVDFFPRLALDTIFPPLHWRLFFYFEFWLVCWITCSSLLLWSWLLQVFVISNNEANKWHSQKPKAYGELISQLFYTV